MCYWWYLGDGSSVHDELRLYTNSFTFDECEFLSDLIPTISKVRKFKNHGKIQPIIIIPSAAIKDFLHFIGPSTPVLSKKMDYAARQEQK